MRNGFRILAWIPLALVAPLLFADARPALTVHEAVLRSDPASDATPVATLPAETDLTVFERLGGWYRVEAGAGAGWLRIASLRFPSAMQGAGESGVDSLLSLMRVGPGAAGGGSSTTTGVRGLDANDLSSASPSEAQIEKLEAQASSADAGRTFAAAARLGAISVAYLEPAELDESLLEQTRSARSSREVESGSGGKAEETCYGDGCDPDIPFLGGG